MATVAALPRIRKLDQTTVNRIAAGEVVQRPSAALKELLENSIDAGATTVTVTAKGGGLKLLQIQDNGHGIKKDDLSIVCERFTTSKLRTFDDLQAITTFGFRGEALASITHVAHVTIISKTEDHPCAYKAKYSDGKLVPVIAGEPAQPKPCAGTRGTTIIVEDMFYNMPTRKQAFKNQSEQYQKIIDVVSRYAIHFGDQGVSITCKKHGQASADIHTPSQSSTLGNIRVIHGPAVARELLEVKYSTPEQATEADNSLVVKARGYLSNANYNSKKATFILFINHRLVDCAPVKRLIESVYTDILPKHTHPYVYLSLEMPPQHVDVNVHPTKREVHFMYEDKLLEAIHLAVRERLQGANQSRVFYTRSVVDGLQVGVVDEQQENSQAVEELSPATGTLSAKPPRDVDGNGFEEHRGNIDKEANAVEASQELSLEEYDGGASSACLTAAAPKKGAKRPRELAFASPSQQKLKTVYAHKLVRTDNRATTLDVFFAASQGADHPPSSSTTGSPPVSNDDDNTTPATIEISALKEINVAADNTGVDAECGCVEETPSAQEVVAASNVSIPGAFVTRCDCCGKSRKQSHKKSAQQQSQEAAKVDIRTKYPPLKETTCDYESIQQLLDDIKTRRHAGLESMLKQHTFVGTVDATFTLLQFGTKLLMIDHAEFSQELFYQLSVRRFGCANRLTLSNPVSVREYVRAGLNAPEAQWTPEDGPKDHVAESITNLLIEKSPMLSEYFCIEVTESGTLTSLPELLQGHRPLPELLPLFLIRLATETNWEDEKACFESISSLIGWFYAQLPIEVAEAPLTPASRAMRLLGERGNQIVQYQILPALKAYIIPPKEFSDDGSVIQVAALEQLYRVFERC